jgi:hypothetical protein
MREFLVAEMSGLSPEVTVTASVISAGLFLSEGTRQIVAARIDDAAAIGMLVETARSLIFSPVPPSVGVDVMFYEEGSEPPAPAIVLRNVCPDGVMSSTCNAERLAAESRRLLAHLRAKNS